MELRFMKSKYRATCEIANGCESRGSIIKRAVIEKNSQIAQAFGFWKFHIFSTEIPTMESLLNCIESLYGWKSLFQLDGNGNKWDIRTTFLKTKVSVEKIFISLKVWYVNFAGEAQNISIQYKFMSFRKKKVCHKRKSKLISKDLLMAIFDLESPEMVNLVESSKIWIFSFQGFRFHHLLRSGQRRQGLSARITRARRQEGRKEADPYSYWFIAHFWWRGGNSASIHWDNFMASIIVSLNK